MINGFGCHGKNMQTAVSKVRKIIENKLYCKVKEQIPMQIVANTQRFMYIYKHKTNVMIGNVDPNTPLWQLTVEQFIEIQKELIKQKPEYVFGLAGLADILGCSVSKALKIKNSGILDEAIAQNGKIIVIDKQLALKLLKENNK